MILSIKEFIKTGKFGEVRIGMSKEDVINRLGIPDSDNDIGANGSILLYAWYELFLNHENILVSIHNDNYDPTDKASYEFENEKIKIDSWFLNNTENQTTETVSTILKNEGIEY
jgi:hypothetical protein